jgi:hypothetical protein
MNRLLPVDLADLRCYEVKWFAEMLKSFWIGEEFGFPGIDLDRVDRSTGETSASSVRFRAAITLVIE